MSATCPTRPWIDRAPRDGMIGMALFQGLLDREGRVLDKATRFVNSGNAALDADAPQRAAIAFVKGRVTGIHESVRLVEHPSFSIEETLEEGHPYHPIPRGAVNPGPRRTSGRHGKWMTYRYRQWAGAVDNRPTSSTPGRCDNRAKYARRDFGLTIVRRDGRWHAEEWNGRSRPNSERKRGSG